MKKSVVRWAVACCVMASSAVLAGSAAAQGAAPQPEPLRPQFQQQISANPFGLLIEFFNAEYERVIGETVTTGVGGSFYTDSGDRYVNGDVFLRYYPQGMPLQRWSFGVKAGITSVRAEDEYFGDRSSTHFGLGFDVNHSWLLGKNDNFYVGLGFGLKRLFGKTDEDYFDLDYVPTIRLINIGFAF
jgi:hypothetical protein